MGKDLRTQTAGLRVGRLPQLSPEEEALWDLAQSQTFIPPIETLFKTETLTQGSAYGFKLQDPLVKVVDSTHIQLSGGRVVPIHRKTTSILGAFRIMRGDYGALGLPMIQEMSEEVTRKLQSPHTAAYVGALTSLALSEAGCPHFPKVYGVYCGIAKKHSIDISDDYEELCERPWFAQNMGKSFQLRMRSQLPGTPQFSHTRGQRPSLQLHEEIVLDGVEELPSGPSFDTPTATSLTLDEVPLVIPEEVVSDEDDMESVASTAQVYEIESCDCGSDASSELEDEDGEEDSFAWAELSNVPVVTTVMEPCEGTLYDLFEIDTDPSHHAAFVAQVVMALAFAQRNFGITHNDLHGNNVMYVRTEREFLDYNLAGTLYRIPTHGFLMKIIDFDRAIVGIRLAKMREPKVFMSDQFQEDEEAGGQYNTEPFYNAKFPEIKPNPSFDLVRLATSIFWDLFPEGPDAPSTHPLKPILLRWMTLPDQSSVLFRSQRDTHDRYHGFHLYKAIARYCKDTAVPRNEPALSAFKTEKIPLGASCVVIEP